MPGDPTASSAALPALLGLSLPFALQPGSRLESGPKQFQPGLSGTAGAKPQNELHIGRTIGNPGTLPFEGREKKSQGLPV